MKQFIVQRIIDNEMCVSLMTPRELINYVNIDDCHGENL